MQNWTDAQIPEKSFLFYFRRICFSWKFFFPIFSKFGQNYGQNYGQKFGKILTKFRQNYDKILT